MVSISRNFKLYLVFSLSCSIFALKIQLFNGTTMIQEFQVQNFYSIRERQSISFVPTNDGNMREQYVHEVTEGVGLLKIGIVYGSNASGKTTLLRALSYFRSTMLNKPESKNEGMGYFPFLLDKYSRNEHSHMQMTFWLNGEKYVLNLEFDSKRIYEESLIEGSWGRFC